MTSIPTIKSQLTTSRRVTDSDDQRLIDSGWVFAGFGLFVHPILSGNRKQKCFTKEQALQQNHQVVDKCVMCGMVGGDTGPPPECKCLYGIKFKLQGNQQ